MATYTKVYNNPYPDGWKDGKDGATPVTADILNNQTETLESIEQYLSDNPIEQGGGSSGTTDYEELENKPTINGVEVVGDLSLEDLGITGSGGSGTTDYNDLSNKPSINGTELSGDITLDIPTKTSDLENDSGFLTEIPEQSYNDLSDKPQINGIDLQGNLTVEELGLLDITESTDTTLENSKDGVLKIKEILGNTTQRTTSGKNELNASGLETATVDGITFTPNYKENGELEYVNVNGTSTGTASYIITEEMNFSSGNSYIMTGCPSGGSQSNYFMSASGVSDFNDFGSGATATFSEDIATEVSIVVMSGATVSDLKFYPMIRDASITDATYEPYTNGASPNPDYPQEIKSVVISEIRTRGKNWFSGVPTEPNVYYSLENEKTELTSWDTYIASVTGGESYTVSGIDTTTGGTGFLAFENDTFLASVSSYKNGTFTVPINCNKLKYSVRKNGKDAFMLEAGTTATDYEPHTESVVTLSEPITLNEWDNVKNGKKNQGSYVKVFDGTEDLSCWDSTTAGGFLFGYHSNSIKLRPSTALTGSFCNYLTEKTDTWLSTDAGFEVARSGTALRFRLDESITSIGLARAWFAEKYAEGNPFTIITQRAEPIKTPLPDADAEALKSLKSYDGVTHIFTDSEIEPDWLVEYNTTRVGTELDEIDAELAKINKRITDIGTTAQINYSTEEQVIGTWIDGKPLYQKTYYFSFKTLENVNYSSDILLGNFLLDNIEYEIIWLDESKSFLFITNSTAGQLSSPVNYPSGSKYIRSNIQKNSETNNGYPYIYLEINYAAQSFYTDVEYLMIAYTIQYTKTTDTI